MPLHCLLRQEKPLHIERQPVLIWRNIQTNWLSQFALSLSLCRCTSSPCTVVRQPLLYSTLETDLTPPCSGVYIIHLVTFNDPNYLNVLPSFANISNSNDVYKNSPAVFYLVICWIDYFWLKLTNEAQNFLLNTRWRVEQLITSSCHQTSRRFLNFTIWSGKLAAS